MHWGKRHFTFRCAVSNTPRQYLGVHREYSVAKVAQHLLPFSVIRSLLTFWIKASYRLFKSKRKKEKKVDARAPYVNGSTVLLFNKLWHASPTEQTERKEVVAVPGGFKSSSKNNKRPSPKVIKWNEWSIRVRFFQKRTRSTFRYGGVSLFSDITRYPQQRGHTVQSGDLILTDYATTLIENSYRAESSFRFVEEKEKNKNKK